MPHALVAHNKQCVTPGVCLLHISVTSHQLTHIVFHLDSTLVVASDLHLRTVHLACKTPALACPDPIMCLSRTVHPF